MNLSKMHVSMFGLVLVVVMMSGMMGSSEAASSSSDNSCASQLIPCADYLNSTKPPSSCCTPLKQTVATQLTCLCNLFNTPGLLESFHINVTQALELSRNCGITQGISSCKESAPSPSSSSTTTPPATPGSDKGSAARVAVTGFSFLALFWASMLFN
ncbi:non-specific lipid transfer protein GPI-anchored 7-like [Arachis stenosperma]|uniref:non-specific lipid transfer protein GPI-anchored 7-like n=1 Tax=Arachis stenosperma TaxID=217475 RepID=UPI0025AD6F0A|nr:non-specific lipid transfer protein GPI-anchored 7-like [Arachis stenosperma]